MTFVLNDVSVLPAAVSTKAASEGFWQRVYAALIESRRRSALRELRAYSYLINESRAVLGGLPGATVSTDATLPFNR